MAKAATFLASAEEGVQRRDLGSAAFCAYQAALQSSFGLQWLLADRFDQAERDRLIELRRTVGSVMSATGRTRAQQFLSSALVPQPDSMHVATLLEKARGLWEFYAEGPMLAWPPDQPTAAGPTPVPTEIVDLVRRLRHDLTALIRSTRFYADLSGMSLTIVLRQSAEFMRSPRYPFAGWISPTIQTEAVAWLDGLVQGNGNS
jgi:hypothetical protein